MSYQAVIAHICSAQIPYRIQDGKIQILDPSLLPSAFRQYFDSSGFLTGGQESGPAILTDFEQDFSESSSWVVNHNLGRKPIVTLLTVGGVEMIAEVIHTNTNQLTVYFASPIAGKARCV